MWMTMNLLPSHLSIIALLGTNFSRGVRDTRLDLIRFFLWTMGSWWIEQTDDGVKETVWQSTVTVTELRQAFALLEPGKKNYKSNPIPFQFILLALYFYFLQIFRYPCRNQIEDQTRNKWFCDTGSKWGRGRRVVGKHLPWMRFRRSESFLLVFIWVESMWELSNGPSSTFLRYNFLTFFFKPFYTNLSGDFCR